MNEHDAINEKENMVPLKDVKTDTNYLASFRAALEEGDSLALTSAVSHLSIGEVNSSFTHAADDVFRIPASTLPQSVQEDLSRQDNIKICAVHYAAMKGDILSLEVLLKSGVDPNAKDTFGQTALHILPKSGWQNPYKKIQECLDVLLAHDRIDLSRLDLSGSTPLSRAEEFQWSYMAKRLRELECNTASGSLQVSKADILWKHLLKPNLKEFKCTLESAKVTQSNISHIINESHGGYTLLQYACRLGMLDFVSVLLTFEASPTCKYDINMLSPVMWAAECGFHRILSMLIKSMTEIDLNKVLMECDDHLETPLHYVVKCKNSKKDPEVNYYQCLQILLNVKKYINIDAKNDDGNTALHIAALCSDLTAFSTLLKKGANSTATNFIGLTPLHYVSKEEMLTILNDCVECDKQKKITDKNFWIGVDYQMMNVKVDDEGVSKGSAGSSKGSYLQNCNTATEMKFLNLVAAIHRDKDILHHPVLYIFMFLKWHNIMKFFYLNFASHIVFLVLLLIYIYIYHSSLPPAEKTNETSNTSNPDPHKVAFMVILLLTLCLREAVELFMKRSWRDYFCDMKNITAVLTILLFIPCCDTYKMGLAACLILISLLDIILHLGRFPYFSVWIAMFNAVARRFFKFICLFSVIIIAFSWSFYLVFQVSEDFRTFPESLVKTMIMTTGEMEYSDLPLSTFPVVTHVLIIFFVFLILLVLMNLLNGLAISDIQVIQKQAEVISCMSLVDRMEQLERSFYCSKNRNPLKRIFDRLFEITLTFKTCLPQHRLYMYINRHAIQYTLSDGTEHLHLCKCHSYKLQTKHIEALKHIIMEKKRAVQ